MGAPVLIVYCASKGGVVNMTRAMAPPSEAMPAAVDRPGPGDGGFLRSVVAYTSKPWPRYGTVSKAGRGRTGGITFVLRSRG